MSKSATFTAPQAATIYGGVTAAQIFAAAQLAQSPAPAYSVACQLAIPGTGRQDGRKFIVRAGGSIYTHTTSNVTIGVYAALPSVTALQQLTVANSVLLKASTARSVVAGVATGCSWWTELALQFDSADGNLQGTQKDVINNLFDAEAALTNQLTGISDLYTEPAFNLVVGVTFSVADALSAAQLTEFLIEG